MSRVTLSLLESDTGRIPIPVCGTQTGDFGLGVARKERFV
jgi:hypothetical protein